MRNSEHFVYSHCYIEQFSSKWHAVNVIISNWLVCVYFQRLNSSTILELENALLPKNAMKSNQDLCVVGPEQGPSHQL